MRRMKIVKVNKNDSDAVHDSKYYFLKIGRSILDRGQCDHSYTRSGIDIQCSLWKDHTDKHNFFWW